MCESRARAVRTCGKSGYHRYRLPGVNRDRRFSSNLKLLCWHIPRIHKRHSHSLEIFDVSRNQCHPPGEGYRRDIGVRLGIGNMPFRCLNDCRLVQRQVRPENVLRTVFSNQLRRTFPATVSHAPRVVTTYGSRVGWSGGTLRISQRSARCGQRLIAAPPEGLDTSPLDTGGFTRYD
ncbi:hypothetical protein GGD50_006603 [Rhizobium paranaense]|uniref:Uncharacterized protein n=1 Tax=Rhizobium paranaense TaxID=1650438 RepID=A0A7W8XYL1_9HYPH|nr:hypothetical protein [Rhizobium paranaense]